MKKNHKYLILTVLLLSALALSACSSGGTPKESQSGTNAQTTAKETPPSQTDATLPGQESETETQGPILAPDFEVTLVTGETIKLSDYRGKKVLLNFWATWCGPCVEEMPAFQKLSTEYPDDIVILAVNCGESEADVKAFVDKNEYTFPIALDESNAATSLYPTYSIPLTVIIDEEGYVVTATSGASDADTMYEHYKEVFELK